MTEEPITQFVAECIHGETYRGYIRALDDSNEGNTRRVHMVALVGKAVNLLLMAADMREDTYASAYLDRQDLEELERLVLESYRNARKGGYYRRQLADLLGFIDNTYRHTKGE